MNRTKIAFLIAVVFALTLTAQEASSASFAAAGALKQGTVGTNPVQRVAGCHTNCRWSFYRAGDGKIYLGCHRNTWSCAFAHLATPGRVAGGAGGTDNPDTRLVALRIEASKQEEAPSQGNAGLSPGSGGAEPTMGGLSIAAS